MTLATVCQNVADQIPVKRPGTIVGNSNPTARLLLSSAQLTGKELAKKNWEILLKEHTFTTVNGTEDYSLPSDFARLLNGTVWDRSNYWDMRGSLSPQQWQAVQSSVLGDTVTTRKRYRVRNVSGALKFSIDPIPSSADSLVFDYASSHWCQDSGGTGQPEFAADTDVFLLDEYLLELGTLWRALKRQRMSYADEKAEYYRELGQLFAQDGGGAPVLNVTPRRGGGLISNANIPDTGFGS